MPAVRARATRETTSGTEAMRSREVRLVILTVVLACLAPALPRAQPASDCDACIAAPGCTATHESCVAECRARLFSIDPRRSDCVASCSNTATVCVQSVEKFCRAGNRCR